VSFRQRSGFTLIELLVVIAIIAILAAMLFPVFARARESARKIQCLSNVKNVAMGIQMYLSDYDRFPPHESPSPDENAFFQTIPGGSTKSSCSAHGMMEQANPYLRWQVVLDEYIKNRDIWRCPSAKYATIGPVWIVNTYGMLWWKYLEANVGAWGRHTNFNDGPCWGAYPPGWGGTVTDSIRQQMPATPASGGDMQGTGGVETTVSYCSQWTGAKTSQVGDASWAVVCGDSCTHYHIWSTASLLYELCYADMNGPGGLSCCASADWSNCAWSQSCGLDPSVYNQWVTDASFRSKYTRHMGGSNVGFADGHASWWVADAFMANIARCPKDEASGTCYPIDFKDRKLMGPCPTIP
jgi:prepilin-type N-terminal cleavage/methylation domain-containing protein/prepilin-type processing-associated H-X9-DG protein